MITISIKEATEIRNCTVQNLQKQVLEHKIQAIIEHTSNNRKRYMILLTELSEKEQIEYYKKHGMEVPNELVRARSKTERSTNMEDYTESQRDNMESNEWWIADTHTFDIMSADNSGVVHKLYLMAFMDARSGIITGYYITDKPSSQGTLIALRNGIIKYGIPISMWITDGSS